MLKYRLTGKANSYHARYRPGEKVTKVFTTATPMTLEGYKARCESMPNESISWIDVESWELEE